MSTTHRQLALALVVGLFGCDKGEQGGDEGNVPAAEHDQGDTDGGAGHEAGAHADPDLEFDEDPVDEGGDAQDEDPKVIAVREDVTKAFHLLQADRLDVDKVRADLDTAKAELDARLAGLAALEKRLDERLGAGDISRKRRDKRIGVLSKLILAMPPQAAAQMVAQMSDADAQAIVLAMSGQNERKASKLLAAMPGDRAAGLGQLYLDNDPKTLIDEAADAPNGKPAQPTTSATVDEAAESENVVPDEPFDPELEPVEDPS